MTTPRDARLTPQELALKLAIADAVQAAGGQSFVAGEIGRAQSVVSDWCTPNTRAFAPVDMIRRIEALGAGAPGHPHVTRALARAAGASLAGRIASPPPGLDDLGDWLAALVKETSDLAGAIAGQDLSECCAALSPAARGRLAREALDATERLQQFLAVLDGIAGSDSS